MEYDKTCLALSDVLESELRLTERPVAFKVVYDGDSVPEDFIHPFKDSGKHYALCQAMTEVRRKGKRLAFMFEDNWCIWPVISLGMVELDESDYEYLGGNHFYEDHEVSHKYFRNEFPKLKTDRHTAGLLMAPLDSCPFTPDAVNIYCRPGKLRTLLMASKYKSGVISPASLDTCASCVHGIIPVLNGVLPYNLSIPDPGEYERGLVDEDDMIFTVAGDRIGELADGVAALAKMGFGYRQLAMDMKSDYARPKFYNDMFEKWGLPRGELWNPGER